MNYPEEDAVILEPYPTHRADLSRVDPKGADPGHAALRSVFQRWSTFPAAESGATQAFEVLLVVGVVLPPLFTAILLLQRVLKEYVEVSNILLTSPFF